MTDKDLDALRRDIDRIDEALHDLIMHRTQVVERIGAVKASGGPILRPAREAAILRRLMARHAGHFPRARLVRVWRELLGAFVTVQGPFTVAVYMPDRGAGYLELARDQYGAYTPTAVYRSVGQVVRAVADGTASVGIVPMPDREGVEPWWLGITANGPEVPRIIARLPFAGPGVGRGDGLEALAVANIAQEATGDDRSWLALETPADVSRGRLMGALTAVGLEPSLFAATQTGEAAWRHLVEIADFVGPGDRRLTLLTEKEPVTHAVAVGGYAVPFSADDVNDEK